MAQALHAAIAQVQDRGDIQYSNTDKLEVEICFHLRNPKLSILDLDNRLKDVFDALQGFVGDKGKSGELRPIIPNDNHRSSLQRDSFRNLGIPPTEVIHSALA